MYVPAGKTFLLHPLRLSGPCLSPYVTIVIDATIVAPIQPLEWRCIANRCDKWIVIKHVNNLTVRGSGTINGQAPLWWSVNDRMRPTAFEIAYSKDINLSGLTFMDNPRAHVHLNKVEFATISNITIYAAELSPNTDGIHVSASKDVIINYCQIATGDDCISIVDGSANLLISNITCGPGHGISIGSLGKHGATSNVENVLVSDVVFINTTNGARIKTWQGGQGHAKNIIFERILLQDCRNPIIIDQFYCDNEQCIEQNSAVKVSDITFREIIGTCQGDIAVKLDCSKSVPCTGIVMENINIHSDSKDKARSLTRNARGISKGQNIPEIRLDNQGP
ncbi:unnamed protein product [Withania somnifera]